MFAVLAFILKLAFAAFLLVFSILAFFVGAARALLIMAISGLVYYAERPTPNDLKVGAVPYVDVRDYGRTIVDNGLIDHGPARFTGYETIRLSLTNNSPVTLFAADVQCKADDIEYTRTSTSFAAYWSGRLSPGETINAEGYIREVHTNPDFIDRSTLKCRIGEVKFDRLKAMLAIGSDNAQTLVETRYDVAVRDLDPGDHSSSARNQITISGGVANRSTLPLYGATFECYLDGRTLPQFSAKFDAPVPPDGRRAFQVSDFPRSFGYDDRLRVTSTSCAVYSYDFGAS